MSTRWILCRFCSGQCIHSLEGECQPGASVITVHTHKNISREGVCNLPCRREYTTSHANQDSRNTRNTMKLSICLRKLGPMHRAIHNILETAGISSTLWICRELQVNVHISAFTYYTSYQIMHLHNNCIQVTWTWEILKDISMYWYLLLHLPICNL